MATPRHRPKRSSKPANWNYTCWDDAGLPGVGWAALAEFFCTAAFIYLATSAVTSGCHTSDVARNSGAVSNDLETVRPGACFLGSSNLIIIALAFGMSIFVLVYAAASLSGGHLNPAITLAMLVTGRMSLLRAVAYIIAQRAGAMAGSGLNRGTDRSGFNTALGAVNQLNSWVSPAAAYGVEALLTALLVFIVFAATDDDRAEDKVHLPFLGPLAIGFMVFLAHVIAVPIDGCSINPARSFGTAVVSGVWEYHWIFWVGPITGALVAGVAYALLSGISLPAAIKHKVQGAAKEYPYEVGSDMPMTNVRHQQGRHTRVMPPPPLGAAAAPAGVYPNWAAHAGNGNNAV